MPARCLDHRHSSIKLRYGRSISFFQPYCNTQNGCAGNSFGSGSGKALCGVRPHSAFLPLSEERRDNHTPLHSCQTHIIIL